MQILLIEDDPAGRELAVFNLRKAGYEVEAAETGEVGLKLFDPSRHALVITDLKMPGLSGMEVLKSVKQKAPELPVLVITAYGSVDVAVEAMKAGAYDFIGKPFNRDHLLIAVSRALETERLRQEVQSLRRQASGVERPIIAKSPAMRSTVELADRVAQSDVPVLISGETGTGKELIARRIHARSPRGSGPFVPLNCAAIPGELMESELFGHEKGAYTGAARARAGRFRQANGGTLVLDEIGELPIGLQPKLLRVLQERAVDVVGADSTVPINTRVLASTNQDLKARSRDGAFREDLLYRINVIEIPVPPLRERPDDLEPLMRHFIQRIAPDRELTLPKTLLEEVRRRSWPGNVRQLENACERLVLLCRGTTLEPEDLPPAEPEATAQDAPGEWPPLPEEGLDLVDLEKRVIERALQLKKGNVTQTAQYLNVPRHILAYRMVKYGIQR